MLLLPAATLRSHSECGKVVGIPPAQRKFDCLALLEQQTYSEPVVLNFGPPDNLDFNSQNPLLCTFHLAASGKCRLKHLEAFIGE